MTVHFEQNGQPVCFLLDLVEVAMSHSGINLAAAFVKILEDFGIENKVSLLLLNRTIETHIACQILSVTCDNASSNDVMIDRLAELIVVFPGAANRTRCFTHILNLVVKVILRQFDVPKSGARNDASSKALLELAEDIEAEEAAMDERADDDDDDEGVDEWVDDPRIGMSQEDEDELELTLQPVRLVLVKVSSNSAYCLSTHN